MSGNEEQRERHLGLFGATGVGVGAIVGGGILALAGVAFATTGPSAMLAFGLNGVIALLTALSFSEMASKFPQSGGTYTFAKRVLSVEAAFMVGWVVWFASIVAAVLYAVGFAHFALVVAGELVALPGWLLGHDSVAALAVVTTLVLAVGLMRRAAGGGQWANFGKVAVFAVLVAGGFWAVAGRAPSDLGASCRPFFIYGGHGLLVAMGYTFIALQGFDLIAAVGGEVKEPARNLPRAMVLSLGIALAIYLPLLFIITTVGTPAGLTVGSMARDDPEALVAVAARNFLGGFGYWLVLVAAVLSMFSALQANLFAASRIAHAMAVDRTLPRLLGRVHATRGTPVVAVGATALMVALLVVALPDVASAGAASSLIFLVTFALAHWISILVRQRSRRAPPFRVPLFPLVPVVGGLACVGLAVFQGAAVPEAGYIAAGWLAVGGLLFLGLFARRARILDASSVARNPELVSLRGRNPLVLVPIANPSNAPAMVTVANSLAPPGAGRALLLSVVVAKPDWRADDDLGPIERAQAVLRESLAASSRLGVFPDTLTTVAPEPVAEIARVAKMHGCEAVVLGLSAISPETRDTPVERLLGALDADVVVLRAPTGWELSAAHRILVPIAGRGGHEFLLARLLGSLVRMADREVTFLRVLPVGASEEDARHARRELRRLALEEVAGFAGVEVARSDTPVQYVAEQAASYDLVILGMRRVDKKHKLFGDFIRRAAAATDGPLIVISRRG